MKKELEEELIDLIKERGDELLKHEENRGLDRNSFIIGFLHGLTLQNMSEGGRTNG